MDLASFSLSGSGFISELDVGFGTNVGFKLGWSTGAGLKLASRSLSGLGLLTGLDSESKSEVTPRVTAVAWWPCPEGDSFEEQL